MISILVLVGLAVVWAIVIFPDVVRWISNNRRGDTIRTFNSQLTSLGRSNAVRTDNVIDLRDRMVAPVVPGNSLRAPNRDVLPMGGGSARGASPRVLTPNTARAQPARTNSGVTAVTPRPVSPAVRKRRQDVLVALGSACLLTLLATIAFGPFFLYLHLLADALLVGYLVLLQRAISTPASRAQTQRDSLAPAAGFAAPEEFGVRPQAMEPRRIAN